jgi:hypothetical protein
MTNRDHEAESPSPWISPLGKLNSEVVGFNSHIANITDIVAQDLKFGRIEVPPNTISALTNQFSTIAFDASSISTRLSNFAGIINTPSTLLLDNQKSASLSSGLVVDSVGSILSSTASMVGAIRSSNEHLCITDQGQIEGLHTNNLLTLTPSMPQASISVDPISQDTILMLGDRLKNDISTFNNLVDTSFATLRLNTEVYTQPIDFNDPYLNGVNQSFTTLNSLSSEIYDNFIGLQPIDTGGFLFQAPIVEPYAAMRATAVLVGVDDEIIDQVTVASTDELLDELGDELVSRLNMAKPELAQVYQEGIAAMKSGHQGWIRHAGVSFRTMFDYLLRHLAPDSDLRSFLEDPESDMVNGEFRRNARLRYIFREVATGAYARMAEEDIKIAEATFFPSSEIVHRLSSPLSERQMRVLWRRIQGSVSVVLEAAGY